MNFLNTAFLSIVAISTSAHAYTPQMQKVIDLVTAENVEYVKSVDQEYELFSFAKADRIPGADFSKPGSAPFVNYLNHSIDSFERPIQPKGEDFGNGLYTAFDPYATQTFGLPNFALFIFPIKKDVGLHFLDFTNGSEQKKALSNNAQQALLALGCTDEDWGDGKKHPIVSLASAFIGSATYAGNPICRQIGIQVLKNLKVDFFIYSYYGHEIKNCNTTEDTYRAAVIVSRSLIQAGRFAVLGKQIPSPDPFSEERRNIEGLAQLQDQPSNPEPAMNYSLWPSLKTNPADSSKYTAWAKKNIFYCQ